MGHNAVLLRLGKPLDLGRTPAIGSTQRHDIRSEAVADAAFVLQPEQVISSPSALTSRAGLMQRSAAGGRACARQQNADDELM
ncbi:hypothetical protein WJX73_008376 [Symbiochloris irregularis]|uniref:Uncharacterized protein n=1 Tax=Symbiochloris irregularis TaxID=706552 RepID=A0AAW1P8E8_9CHLO